MIQDVSDKFLDLAVATHTISRTALPVFHNIILVTAASRLILTVPFSIWVFH